MMRYTKRNSQIRILLATGLYPPEVGGPATYAALVEKELTKRGMKVSVLPFRDVRRWPIGIRHSVYFFACFIEALKSDLVFAQDPVSVGLPAMLAAKLTRRPFVIRVPGDYAWEQAVQRIGIKGGIDDFQKRKYGWRTEFLRAIQKWVVGEADLVITPSKYFQKLVSGWIKKPEKVKVIYNGIDLKISNFQFPTSNESTKTILSAGRLVPWKGFDILIEMMKDLPDWKLVIVGDGPEREALSVKCQVSGVKDRVRLIGAVSREKLLEHLRNASVFALNTSFESFSFQVVETMNAGVPVVTTNICDLPEIIENNKEGVLVEPDNKEQIIAAIKKISSDDEFRKTIIRNAKLKARKFSIENTVNNLVEGFKHVLAL